MSDSRESAKMDEASVVPDMTLKTADVPLRVYQHYHMSTMKPGERVRAALKGEKVDRVPLCFWHHFKPEGSGEKLAQLTFEFFIQKFKLDIVKVMPDLHYPSPDPSLAKVAQVQSLPRLDLTTPMFHEQLVCVRLLRSQLGDDYPLILTLNSPFTTIKLLIGKNAAVELARSHPGAFKQGMAIVASNLSDLMAAAVGAGADGIFFSCMGATSAEFSFEEYLHIVRPYDLQALEGAKAGWLNIVHIHADTTQGGDDLYFENFIDYPVSVMSWSDRVTGPTISEALTMTDKCLMGGLSERGPLMHGDEVELNNEIVSAASQARGSRLILANGCSVPDDVDEHWLGVARQLVENLA